MTELVDQAERDRFVQLHGRNISVIAPAGVGKTTAIVNRIVHIAQLEPASVAADRLSRLVVVTYSVRAAQQMQQRARAGLRSVEVRPEVQRAFQQTFFGTIHSYCVRLLDRFGHHLGLPSPVKLLQDDEEMWNRFLLRGLPAEMAHGSDELLAFYGPEALYELGRRLPPGNARDPGIAPRVEVAAILDFLTDSIKGGTRAALVRAQARARDWAEAWEKGERPRQFPKPTSSDKVPEFTAAWQAAFLPLQSWLRAGALAFGRRVANAYEAFRLAEAVMTYDDQVRLALRVLENPAAQRELAEERTSVLLDEAQDTDPHQFDVLLRVAGLGKKGDDQPEDQSFAIVGDFQQAIYEPRSDLSRYRGVHDRITTGPRGASSVLRVTFRCDRAIIDFVNRVFPSVLDQARGQSKFEPLAPRNDAGPGQVIRWRCADEPEPAANGKVTADARAACEVRFVARKLLELGPGGLGVGDWSEVAILCPRNKWLAQLQDGLLGAGLPVQLHASNEASEGSIADQWLTALVWIAAHPEDDFEIAGVLREVLGTADDDMARYTAGTGAKLRLDQPSFPGGPAVQAALDLLRSAFSETGALPLAQAVGQMVERTQLRERLRLVTEPALADRELDDCLAQIAVRAAEGVTLHALAQEMRTGLAQANAGEAEIRDAIQLMTSYKAKGLEWPVVIVPFLFRSIRSKAPVYPRVDADARGREILSRDKDDFLSQVGEFVHLREEQQFQRLFYVASTRAKHTLIWIDDEPLYADPSPRGGKSGAQLLDFAAGGSNRVHWEALAEVGAPAERSVAAMPGAAHDPPDLRPPLDSRAVELARANANRIPRRITPHLLAVHADRDAEPGTLAEMDEDDGAAREAAIRYGIWWHEMVQSIPWNEPRAAWERAFAAARSQAPDTRRAAKEWKLFIASTLGDWLARPGQVVHVEWPFLLPGAGDDCVEGVMDLAVFSEAENTWQVIDWKTNRPGPRGAAGLVESYRGQIDAYVGALRNLLAAEVKGSLYLTATGAWETMT